MRPCELPVERWPRIIKLCHGDPTMMARRIGCTTVTVKKFLSYHKFEWHSVYQRYHGKPYYWGDAAYKKAVAMLHKRSKRYWQRKVRQCSKVCDIAYSLGVSRTVVRKELKRHGVRLPQTPSKKCRRANDRIKYELTKFKIAKEWEKEHIVSFSELADNEPPAQPRHWAEELWGC